MFIQTEATPNPRTMKFIPGLPVMKDGTASFTDKDAAEASPLAAALFAIERVEGVFFGPDFIAVTRAADADWNVLKPYVLTTVMEHFVAGHPLLHERNYASHVTQSSTASDSDDPLVRQIRELIDTRVRPAVAEDGGDIVFRGFENGIVKLQLHGACSGCPSSTATLKQGIENMLKHYVPEVEAVEAVEAVNE